MSLPVVAIVGRPNVGKSSLLNMLARRRISIVDPMAGVTRDRVSAVCDVDDRYFELIDTGGHGVEDHDQLTDHVEKQIEMAVAGASMILFVVDIREEVTPLDQEVAKLLRGVRAPVVLVANKADTEAQSHLGGPLTRLGFGEPLRVSALHARGRREILEKIVATIGDLAADGPPQTVMKLALVGRRNVGKSTFINALAGQPRVIVSEVPGTTRDAIDVRFEMNDSVFTAIDTAGVGKKSRHRSTIEFYGYTRAMASILRADVILFLIDSTVPISDVDKKLARYIVDSHKPCVIVINKWDLAKGAAAAEDYGDYLTRAMPHISFAPLAFTTATEGRNIQATVDLARGLFRQSHHRVTTGELNRAIEQTLAEAQPSAGKHGGQPKIYYATQIATGPPTIVLFVNNPALMREQYRRFVEKRMRETLPFDEIPLRFIWRARQGDENSRSRGKRPARKGAVGGPSGG